MSGGGKAKDQCYVHIRDVTELNRLDLLMYSENRVDCVRIESFVVHGENRITSDVCENRVEPSQPGMFDNYLCWV